MTNAPGVYHGERGERIPQDLYDKLKKDKSIMALMQEKNLQTEDSIKDYKQNMQNLV